MPHEARRQHEQEHHERRHNEECVPGRSKAGAIESAVPLGKNRGRQAPDQHDVGADAPKVHHDDARVRDPVPLLPHRSPCKDRELQVVQLTPGVVVNVLPVARRPRAYLGSPDKEDPT